MNLATFVQHPPKCKKHDVNLTLQTISIKTPKDKYCSEIHQFWVCGGCHPEKERTEEFYKKIALDYMQQFDSSYNLSDIEVKVL